LKVFIDASLIVYLNVPLPENEAKAINDFYRNLLQEDLYTDILALDEAIYVSRRKYGITIQETLELIDKAILPNVEIIPLGEAEYTKGKEHMLKYGLKPSDAIHLAAMDNNGIQAIATEDKDYDKTHIRRLWAHTK